MTHGERMRLLCSYGRASTALCAALRQFPKKMWLYKVTPDRWSIHECVLHLADKEAIEYVWCRRFIAQPGSATLTFEASSWAGRLGYFHQNACKALQIITVLRGSTHELLTRLPESFWHTAFEHSGHGEINLERWLEAQERYIPSQMDNMRDTYRIWLNLNPPRKSPSNREEATPVSATHC